MFKIGKASRLTVRTSWLASGIVHVVVLVLAFTVAWRAKPRMTFINLPQPVVRGLPDLPPRGGTERGRGPSGGLGHPVPAAAAPAQQAAPAPVGQVDSTLAASPRDVGRHIVPGPRMSDPRIWPSPRPALPGEVAEALYSRPDTARRDSVAVRRLRDMVDSLGQVIDVEQREHRLPAWTSDVGGKKFGMDSSGIYVAGIMIPTPVLAMLGNMLPQGNYDEYMRSRHLEDLRQDLLQAARRTETLQQFRQYVREIRARKQAERDTERRARGDTIETAKDTVRAVP